MIYRHVRQARHAHYNNVLRFEKVAAIDGSFPKGLYVSHPEIVPREKIIDC